MPKIGLAGRQQAARKVMPEAGSLEILRVYNGEMLGKSTRLQGRTAWPGATFTSILLWGGLIWPVLSNMMRTEIICITPRPKWLKVGASPLFLFASICWTDKKKKILSLKALHGELPANVLGKDKLELH